MIDAARESIGNISREGVRLALEATTKHALIIPLDPWPEWAVDIVDRATLERLWIHSLR